MDNTVGSLTQFQWSVIVGCILGDGYLRIFPSRKNAILEINHSIIQKEYVDWKYKVLKNAAASPPKIRKGNGDRIAYRFYTKQLPELTVLLKKFYKERQKIIPKDLMLDPVILAVWFMDDGTRCGEADFYLNTQQYGITDQFALMDKLQKLGLMVRLNRDKKYWRIRFLKSSIPRLQFLIQDLIIPSMRYKVGL